MWASVLSIIIGGWLMIAPAAFTMSAVTAHNHYITAPLVIAFSIVSLWDINRSVLKVNLLTGAWLLGTSFVFPFTSWVVLALDVVAAVALILLALVKQKEKQNFGGGWRSLFQAHPPHMQEAEKQALHNQP